MTARCRCPPDTSWGWRRATSAGSPTSSSSRCHDGRLGRSRSNRPSWPSATRPPARQPSAIGRADRLARVQGAVDVLGDELDRAPEVPQVIAPQREHRRPAEGDRAGHGSDEAQQGAQGGRLARAALAHQRQGPAGGELQRREAQGREAAGSLPG